MILIHPTVPIWSPEPDSQRVHLDHGQSNRPGDYRFLSSTDSRSGQTELAPMPQSLLLSILGSKGIDDTEPVLRSQEAQLGFPLSPSLENVGWLPVSFQLRNNPFFGSVVLYVAVTTAGLCRLTLILPNAQWVHTFSSPALCRAIPETDSPQDFQRKPSPHKALASLCLKAIAHCSRASPRL